MQSLLYGVYISKEMVNGKRESTIRPVLQNRRYDQWLYRWTEKKSLKFFQMCLRIYAFCCYVNNY